VALKSIYITLDKRVITTNQFLKRVAPLLRKLKKEGFEVQIGGAKKVNTQFMRDLVKSAVVALTLILLVLILMFNSFRLPLAIISVIFLSMLGVLIGNWLLGLNMTMLTRIGMVGLAGVVVNDGIVMLDFLKRAKSVPEMLELASYRLRPILLTSITTFFGFFTLIFFPFGQAKILQPLAVALGFGLFWSTILNLYYLPLVYYLINRKRLKSGEK
jgi:multidrug efflux pump subunit AcrB